MANYTKFSTGSASVAVDAPTQAVRQMTAVKLGERAVGCVGSGEHGSFFSVEGHCSYIPDVRITSWYILLMVGRQH